VSEARTDGPFATARAAGVTVRPFRPSDQAAARSLIEQGLGEHFGFIDREANPDLVDIGATYRAPHAAFFVADLRGALVGTAGALIDQHAVRMVRLGVAREHRRLKIASALLDRVIELAAAAGVAEVIAYTEPAWQDAMRFYSANGFVQFGEDDVDVYLRRPLSGI
jgi:GNAT superfamily N-acetyltransferase